MNFFKIWIDKHFEDFEEDTSLDDLFVGFVNNRSIHPTASN